MDVAHVATEALAGMAAPFNPRTISGHDLDALRRSLRFFGTVEPIVVNRRSGHIVGGHQRVKAAQAEGIDEMPVVYVDLDDPAEKQLNVALNRIHGEWDESKLEEILADLKTAGADLALTGFTEEELDELLRGPDAPADGLTDPDAVPGLPAQPITRRGDLITLGRHRLLCGDSTDAPQLTRLMDGKRACCLWTDPPYGVHYEGKTARRLTIENDSAEGLPELLRGAFAAASAVLEPGARIYIAHPAGRLSVEFAQAFLEAGWALHQTLVWRKDIFVLGHSDYHYQHEPILYGHTPAKGRVGRGGKHWYGDNAQTSVLDVPRPRASEEHPTSKPVELIEIALRNSTPRDGMVLDLFGGSGSTLIAAERLGRRAFLLEIDPAYADVVVTRWEDFSGQKAQRPGKAA